MAWLLFLFTRTVQVLNLHSVSPRTELLTIYCLATAASLYYFTRLCFSSICISITHNGNLIGVCVCFCQSAFLANFKSQTFLCVLEVLRSFLTIQQRQIPIRKKFAENKYYAHNEHWCWCSCSTRPDAKRKSLNDGMLRFSCSSSSVKQKLQHILLNKKD